MGGGGSAGRAEWPLLSLFQSEHEKRFTAVIKKKKNPINIRMTSPSRGCKDLKQTSSACSSHFHIKHQTAQLVFTASHLTRPECTKGRVWKRWCICHRNTETSLKCLGWLIWNQLQRLHSLICCANYNKCRKVFFVLHWRGWKIKCCALLYYSSARILFLVFCFFLFLYSTLSHRGYSEV